MKAHLSQSSFQRSRSTGFTLLEVIFALLILAIGVLGILQGQSGSARLALRSEAMAQALYLAEMKMTEVELQLRQKTFISMPEEEKGEFQEEKLKQYRWIRNFEKVDVGCFIPKSLMEGESGEGETAAQGYFALIEKVFENAVRKIKISVEWTEGNQTRSVELSQLYVRLQDLGLN